MTTLIRKWLKCNGLSDYIADENGNTITFEEYKYIPVGLLGDFIRGLKFKYGRDADILVEYHHNKNHYQIKI